VTSTDRPHPLAVDDDDTYDPFEAFNAHFGAGAVTTLYPAYAELRAKCPVLPTTELFDKLGISDPMGDAGAPSDSVYTFRGVDQALRDRDGYSVSSYAASLEPLLGHTLLTMDEPEHMRVRRLVVQAFGPAAMKTWQQRVVIPVVDRHIDAFAVRGRADLVNELTFPFPVYVIGGILGLPDADLPLFHRRAVEIVSIIHPERSLRASQCLADYFQEIIAARRVDPRDDVISLLASTRLDGEELTDSEIIDFCRLLLPAGAETTYRSTSNLLFALLHHPKQLAAITADRSLIPQAVEEGLRWETPVTGCARLARQDTTVDDVQIAAGTQLTLSMAAGNRDPSRYDRPDEFDVFRKGRAHISFGSGTHVCLGSHLARMETAVVLNAVLDRLPGLRLDPDAEPIEIEGLHFRAPPRLPVVWDVASVR
jgi:cytochrome P450